MKYVVVLSLLIPYSLLSMNSTENRQIMCEDPRFLFMDLINELRASSLVDDGTSDKAYRCFWDIVNNQQKDFPDTKIIDHLKRFGLLNQHNEVPAWIMNIVEDKYSCESDL